MENLIILAVFVVLGYLLGSKFKVRGKMISAILLAVIILVDYIIKDVTIIAIISVSIGIATILKGLCAGLLFRKYIK